MKITGIYMIKNMTNGHTYIGSSKDIKSRWYQHKHKLKHNKHENDHLQKAWNKYGGDAFVFSILEECVLDKNLITAREQFYLDTIKPEYNILSKAYTSLGRKHSDKTKKKISENNFMKKFGHSEETKKQISKTLKGKSKSSSHILKMCHRKHDNGTKDKISQSLLGHECSVETKQKISESCRGRIPWNKGITGKKQTEESNQKRREAIQRYWENKRKEND